MQTLGIYIYNATRNKWLSDDEKSWVGFDDGVAEFTEGNEQLAEDIRLRETKNDDVTFVMAALH
jgi:hypothetical protein